jgi:predicted anti-sigma-YlaC factor YlaD
MSDHILELLGAYIDSELHGEQLRKVEAHLDVCQSCLEEYYALKALSATLLSAPVPAFPSPEHFAADLALRLPRKPVKPLRRRAMEVGWWLAPVGLIATWIFISTTILVSNVVTAANEFGLLNSAPAGLFSGSSSAAYWSATLGQFGVLAGETLQWAELTESFTRTTVPQFTWQISIALLYLSWMAIWWARHSRQGSTNPAMAAMSPKGEAGPQSS